MRSRYPLRLISRLVFSFIAAVWLTSQQQLHAEDLEAYSEAKHAATTTFLDSSQPKRERLEAAKNLRYPDEKTFAAMLEIGADRKQDDDIRWEALRRHRYDRKYIDTVLKILGDPEDGSEELDARLIEDLGRRTTFRLPAELRQQIQSTWRKLLDDPRNKVRLGAYRVAVANHDPVAVNLLAESLRKGQDFPIPLPEAIDLLDLDGSVNHIAALRPYLTHEDPRVQAQAARALAVDPESRPKIVELARNPQTPGEVRLHALRALAREDGQFANYAILLVEDTKEDPKIRYAAMQAFAGRMNYHKVDPANQVRFAQAVEKLAADNELTTEDARKIKEEAGKLNSYLRKSFPEVQKYYENR